jgi:hypothetical protein
MFLKKLKKDHTRFFLRCNCGHVQHVTVKPVALQAPSRKPKQHCRHGLYRFIVEELGIDAVAQQDIEAAR